MAKIINTKKEIDASAKVKQYQSAIEEVLDQYRDEDYKHEYNQGLFGGLFFKEIYTVCDSAFYPMCNNSACIDIEKENEPKITMKILQEKFHDKAMTLAEKIEEKTGTEIEVELKYL